MRCTYCYNPEIVLGKGKLSWDDVREFLLTRIGLLDGVVFSGGECTIHPQIIPFAREMKAMGFEVKIDTNGSKPEVLKNLIEENLVDFVALDFKGMPGNYWRITRSHLFKPFEQSLKILLGSPVRFEVRTTVHPDLLNYQELNEMEKWLRDTGFSGTFYLQLFRGDKETLGGLAQTRKPDFVLEQSVWRT